MSSSGEQRELNTGLIIAGAYGDKVRRTLFAQLSEFVKKDKEFSKEVARASGELNIVLYHILVSELKVEKGDVVRVRVNYTVDQATRRIRWLYDTLRVEVFKRVSDERASQAVSRIVFSDRLNQILESFRLTPTKAEEVVRAFEISEEAERRLPEIPPPPAPPEKPSIPLPVEVTNYIGSVDLIGETVDGGYLVKFTSREGVSMGIASITPVDNEVMIDAVVIHGDKCYRYVARSKARIAEYGNTPENVLDDLRRTRPVEIPKDQAMSIIREKMQSLV